MLLQLVVIRPHATHYSNVAIVVNRTTSHVRGQTRCQRIYCQDSSGMWSTLPADMPCQSKYKECCGLAHEERNLAACLVRLATLHRSPHADEKRSSNLGRSEKPCPRLPCKPGRLSRSLLEPLKNSKLSGGAHQSWLRYDQYGKVGFIGCARPISHVDDMFGIPLQISEVPLRGGYPRQSQSHCKESILEADNHALRWCPKSHE